MNFRGSISVKEVGRLGWGATWPFAGLNLTPTDITITVFPATKYVLPLKSIKRVILGKLPFLGARFVFEHDADVPKYISFGVLPGNPLKQIVDFLEKAHIPVERSEYKI